MPQPVVREDLSTKLIHLTRGDTLKGAVLNFLQILNEKKLIGSSTDIRGGYKCVCFTEAPITKLAVVLSRANEMRYAPLGVIIGKEWLYSKGARPVIYQSGKEFDLLPEGIKYRHVRYEPDKEIDYSWEREWRIKIDELALLPESTTFIIPTRKWYEKIVGDWYAGVRLRANAGAPIFGNKPNAFIILEDLGIPIVNEYGGDKAIGYIGK